MDGRTTFWPDGNSSVFSRLAHHDFLTFLAIAQKLHGVPFFNDPDWTRGHNIWKVGGNGAIHRVGNDMVLKRFRITDDVGEKLAYKTLICELLVLAHPVLKHHPNIQKLSGLTWDIRIFQPSSFRVMPVLVFERCESGTLAEFMSSKVPFSQRVSLCENIGRAIEAMHEFGVVHGDIKPNNVLIFLETGGFVAKVIDFGCSTFGAAKDDRILVGRTVPWAAPELCDTPITIQAAMQADVYSYGKVCAWIFFGQEMSIADFARLPFNFNQAVARQMQTIETGWDELRGRPALRSLTLPLLENFFKRTLQGVTQRQDQNMGSLMKIWEKLQKMLPDDIYSRSRHNYFDVSSIRRLKIQLRSLLGRAMVFTILRRDPEVFVPGPPQLIFQPSHASFSIVQVTGILIFSIFFIHSVVAKQMLVYWAVVLGVGLVAICWINTWETLLQDVRHLTRDFSIFGRIEHVVPDVAQLYPMLNEAHYLVREQLINELEKRARSGCTTCQEHAALQLALCFSTAFGTPRDIASSKSWLESGNKTERDLKRLQKDAEYMVEIAEVEPCPRLCGDAQRYEFPHPAERLISDPEECNPQAVLRYRQEIDGRIKSGVSLRSVAILRSKLGILFFSRRDYQLAEDQFRQALKIENELTPHRSMQIRRMNFLITYDQSPIYAHLLALALDAQAKEQEAIEVLNGIKFMTYGPKGKGIFWELIRRLIKPGWEETGILAARELLVDLLIKQRELDKVLKMNPLSTLDRLLAIEDTGDDTLTSSLAVRRALKNIRALAHFLFEQGRRCEATHIFRQRRMIFTRHFGQAHLLTLQATGEFMFMLSELKPEQIHEALCLEVPTPDESSSEANNEILLLKTIYAYALSKNGQLNEAIAEMDWVLRIKDRIWTEADYATRCCMSPLVDILGFHGKREWREPVTMQRELVLMFKRVPCPRIQELIIALLCALARIDGLHDALTLMKRLVEQLRLTCPGQWRDRCRIQEYLVSTLSSLGLCFHDAQYLNEALDLGSVMKNEVSQTCGPEAEELLDVVVLLASVYSKKSIVLCHFHGFGLQEANSMKEAESIHQLAVDMAIKILGNTHEKTVNALEQLEALVSRYALARANEPEEKVALRFCGRTEQMLASSAASRNLSESWLLPTIRLTSEYGDQVLQLQYITIEQNLEFQKEILAILERELDLCHPVLQTQMEHVGRMELRNGQPRKALRWLKLIPLFLGHYQLRRNSVITPHPQIIRALQAIAQAYERDGATYLSRPILKHVVHLAQRTFRGGDAHPTTTLYSLNLMRLLSEDGGGSPTTMISNAQDRLQLARQTFGEQHTQTLYCMNELAEALLLDSRRRHAVLVTYEALRLGLPLWAFSHVIASRLWKNFLTAHNRIADDAKFSAKLKEVLLPLLEKNWRKGLFSNFAHVSHGGYTQEVMVEAAFAAVKKLILSSWALGPDHEFTKSMKHEVKSLVFFHYDDMKPIIQQGTLLRSVELPPCEPFDLGSFAP